MATQKGIIEPGQAVLRKKLFLAPSLNSLLLGGDKAPVQFYVPSATLSQFREIPSE